MCKKIKKVYITPGCISCGSCEAICPKVFEVKGVAEVRKNANVDEDPELVREAADMCPVNVIQVEEGGE